MEYRYFLNKQTIKNILQEKQNNVLHHCYLFSSPDKLLNSCYLQALSIALMCENSCYDDCEVCAKVVAQTHPDVIIYPKSKTLSVDDSKDIVEEATKKPMLSDKRIIIINDIDNSSEEAQNKLLKILEEPPKNIYFLASCTNTNKVLPTIMSRMTKLFSEKLNTDEIEQIFEDKKNLPVFDLAIEKCNGYIGIAKQILENENYLKYYILARDIVCKLKSSSETTEYLLNKIDREEFGYIITNIYSFIRDIMMLKLNKEDLIENKNSSQILKQVQNEYSLKATCNILKLLDKINEEQFSNVSINLIYETLLVSLLEVKFLCK